MTFLYHLLLLRTHFSLKNELWEPLYVGILRSLLVSLLQPYYSSIFLLLFRYLLNVFFEVLKTLVQLMEHRSESNKILKLVFKLFSEKYIDHTDFMKSQDLLVYDLTLFCRFLDLRPLTCSFVFSISDACSVPNGSFLGGPSIRSDPVFKTFFSLKISSAAAIYRSSSAADRRDSALKC